MVRTERSCGLLAAFLTVLSTTPAGAKPWLELRAGPALTSGHFEYEVPYRTEDGFDTAVGGNDGPIGVGLDLDGIAGISIGSELGVGLLGRLEFAHYVKQINLAYDTGRDQLMLGIGPTLALRAWKSMQVGASLEYAHAVVAMSSIDIGAVDNVYEPESVSGVGASLSLGCCAEPGLGFAMTGRAAWLAGKHTQFIPVTVAILATYSSW